MRIVDFAEMLQGSITEKIKQCKDEMILDAAETVLGYFGFDRSAYSKLKKRRKRKWYEELREQRVRDIEIETI